MKQPAKIDNFIERTILVLFGITGDLAHKKILPSLYHLDLEGLLPKGFQMVGFARHDLRGAKVRNYVKKVLIAGGKRYDGRMRKFLEKISFVQGDAGDASSFLRLAAHLNALEKHQLSCANRLFYFATLPSLYRPISEQLKRCGLLIGCAGHKRETRVMVEKPFGSSLQSAQELDRILTGYFSERQIYRMDHYLGKETLQNILTVRFANTIFEPIWNREYIDHVQISGVMEKSGVDTRGAYYEQNGALRDVVQNHLMQMLALTVMEKPADSSAEAIRAERAKALKNLKLLKGREALLNTIRGQYGAGVVGGKKVRGYRQEAAVAKKSQVETYVAMKFFHNSDRWAGVPFFLRTGKRVHRDFSQISLHFKKPAAVALFGGQEIQPNVLTFSVQPDERIYARLTVKKPGFGVHLHSADMRVGSSQELNLRLPSAYERLILDFFEGDQRLFADSSEIEAAWRFIDPIAEAWSSVKAPRFPNYAAGSNGPRQAEEFLTREGKSWWEPEDIHT